MKIQDPQIIRLIENIGEHYRSNIANRFLRPSLLQLPIESQTWDLLELLMERGDQYHHNGYELEDLYRQLLAAVEFVYKARQNLANGGRGQAQRTGHIVTGQDKILWDMAVNNFGSNLRVLADLLKELYALLVEADKAAARGRVPRYTKIPDLADIGQRLGE
jgi:hypothetical protein